MSAYRTLGAHPALPDTRHPKSGTLPPGPLHHQLLAQTTRSHPGCPRVAFLFIKKSPECLLSYRPDVLVRVRDNLPQAAAPPRRRGARPSVILLSTTPHGRDN